MRENRDGKNRRGLSHGSVTATPQRFCRREGPNGSSPCSPPFSASPSFRCVLPDPPDLPDGRQRRRAVMTTGGTAAMTAGVHGPGRDGAGQECTGQEPVGPSTARPPWSAPVCTGGGVERSPSRPKSPYRRHRFGGRAAGTSGCGTLRPEARRGPSPVSSPQHGPHDACSARRAVSHVQSHTCSAAHAALCVRRCAYGVVQFALHRGKQNADCQAEEGDPLDEGGGNNHRCPDVSSRFRLPGRAFHGRASEATDTVSSADGNETGADTCREICESN